MNLRRVPAILISLPVLLALGCYSPNIGSGRYACGADGGCPDNFHCASNHLCYQGNDSFDMSPVCESDASAPQVCSTVPATGQACNPVCQTGCGGCGWCAVVDGATKCLTGNAGTKNVGATCDPSKNSDCSPGLYCQPETCGTVTAGSCYLLCDPSKTTNGVNSVCGAMSACNVTAKKNGGGTLPFILCSPVCDPLSQTNVSCPAPFGCYPSGPTTTECDCAGSASIGDPCLLADTCSPGQTCAGPNGGGATCRPICTATVACTSGACNIPTGAASGTCM